MPGEGAPPAAGNAAFGVFVIITHLYSIEADDKVVGNHQTRLPGTVHAFYFWHITQKFPSCFKACLKELVHDFFEVANLEDEQAFFGWLE